MQEPETFLYGAPFSEGGRARRAGGGPCRKKQFAGSFFRGGGIKRLFGVLFLMMLMISTTACGREPYTKTAVVMDTVVELALDFGEILDLPLNLVALLLLLLCLLLVALLLVLEGGGERCKRSCGNGNCYSQSCKFCVLELQCFAFFQRIPFDCTIDYIASPYLRPSPRPSGPSPLCEGG